MAYYNGKEIFFGAKVVGAGGSASENSVLYVPQELTTDQKEQAQKNIGTNTLIVTIDDSKKASHTPKQIISHVEGGGKALLLYRGDYCSLSHTDANHVVFSWITSEFECVRIEVNPDRTLNINAVYVDLVVDTELDATSTNPVQNKAVAVEIQRLDESIRNFTVDDALSATSTNPVQNKVVQAAISGVGSQASSALEGLKQHGKRLTAVEADVADLKENGGGKAASLTVTLTPSEDGTYFVSDKTAEECVAKYESGVPVSVVIPDENATHRDETIYGTMAGFYEDGGDTVSVFVCSSWDGAQHGILILVGNEGLITTGDGKWSEWTTKAEFDNHSYNMALRMEDAEVSLRSHSGRIDNAMTRANEAYDRADAAKNAIGDINAALDSIIDIQQSLMGGAV